MRTKIGNGVSTSQNIVDVICGSPLARSEEPFELQSLWKKEGNERERERERERREG